MKFTVKRSGFTAAGESIEEQLVNGEIDKAFIGHLLDKSVFYDTRATAESIDINGEAVKRQVKITVEINDVVSKKKKK